MDDGHNGAGAGGAVATQSDTWAAWLCPVWAAAPEGLQPDAPPALASYQMRCNRTPAETTNSKLATTLTRHMLSQAQDPSLQPSPHLQARDACTRQASRPIPPLWPIELGQAAERGGQLHGSFLVGAFLRLLLSRKLVSQALRSGRQGAPGSQLGLVSAISAGRAASASQSMRSDAAGHSEPALLTVCVTCV